MTFKGPFQLEWFHDLLRDRGERVWSCIIIILEILRGIEIFFFGLFCGRSSSSSRWHGKEGTHALLFTPELAISCFHLLSAASPFNCWECIHISTRTSTEFTGDVKKKKKEIRLLFYSQKGQFSTCSSNSEAQFSLVFDIFTIICVFKMSTRLQ